MLGSNLDLSDSVLDILHDLIVTVSVACSVSVLIKLNATSVNSLMMINDLIVTVSGACSVSVLIKLNATSVNSLTSTELAPVDVLKSRL